MCIRDSIEIAELDGISRMRTLRDIILPICRPSIVATGIIFFINSWNEYVWPTLILRSKENYTLSLAMQLFSSSEAGTEFTTVMAMAVISMPVSYTHLLMQAAMDQRADAVQWTAWPGSALEAQQALIDMRDQILGGTKDVSTAMDECQVKVQGFIED